MEVTPEHFISPTWTLLYVLDKQFWWYYPDYLKIATYLVFPGNTVYPSWCLYCCSIEFACVIYEPNVLTKNSLSAFFVGLVKWLTQYNISSLHNQHWPNFSRWKWLQSVVDCWNYSSSSYEKDLSKYMKILSKKVWVHDNQTREIVKRYGSIQVLILTIANSHIIIVWLSVL